MRLSRTWATISLPLVCAAAVSGAIPESWRYYARPVEFGWVDIEGAALGFRGADEYVVETELGFSFPFFGADYDRVSVSANGLLLFGSATVADHANAALPAPEPPNGIVACFWTDLCFPPGGEVYRQTLGDAPNRRFVVQWAGAARFGVGGAATFQAVLEEGSGRIRLNFLDTDFGDARVDAGADAACGLEDSSGQTGLTWSWRKATLPSRSSVELRPAPPAWPAVAAVGWGRPGETEWAQPGDVAAPLWVELRNEGPLWAGELELTLAAEAGVTVTQNSCLIPELLPGASATAVFRASVPAGCPCAAAPAFHLQLDYRDELGRSWRLEEPFELPLGQPGFTKIFLDDMEHGSGQWSTALPVGAEGWRLAAGPWPGSGQAWFVPGEEGLQEALLTAPAAVLPPLTVPAGGQLLFNHWWDLEKDYDGAVLELRIEGTDQWLDLGPYLTAGGYTGALPAEYGNPLVPPETPAGATRPAWTFSSDAPAPGETVADLGRFAGEPVRWRFRLGSDVSTASAGWWVDDVVVWGEVRDCALARPGDVDSDLDVDGGDLVALLLGLGGVVAPGQWPYARPAWADLDGDGEVGAPDLALLSAHLAGGIPLSRGPGGSQGNAGPGRWIR